jgi:hypothetical protein
LKVRPSYGVPSGPLIVPIQDSRLPSRGKAEMPGVADICWGIVVSYTVVCRNRRTTELGFYHKLHQLGLQPAGDFLSAKIAASETGKVRGIKYLLVTESEESALLPLDLLPAPAGLSDDAALISMLAVGLQVRLVLGRLWKEYKKRRERAEGERKQREN